MCITFLSVAQWIWPAVVSPLRSCSRGACLLLQKLLSWLSVQRGSWAHRSFWLPAVLFFQWGCEMCRPATRGANQTAAAAPFTGSLTDIRMKETVKIDTNTVRCRLRTKRTLPTQVSFRSSVAEGLFSSNITSLHWFILSCLWPKAQFSHRLPLWDMHIVFKRGCLTLHGAQWSKRDSICCLRLS